MYQNKNSITCGLAFLIFISKRHFKHYKVCFTVEFKLFQLLFNTYRQGNNFTRIRNIHIFLNNMYVYILSKPLSHFYKRLRSL